MCVRACVMGAVREGSEARWLCELHSPESCHNRQKVVTFAESRLINDLFSGFFAYFFPTRIFEGHNI